MRDREENVLNLFDFQLLILYFKFIIFKIIKNKTIFIYYYYYYILGR